MNSAAKAVQTSRRSTFRTAKKPTDDALTRGMSTVLP
jgi:hypothetical protein